MNGKKIQTRVIRKVSKTIRVKISRSLGVYRREAKQESWGLQDGSPWYINATRKQRPGVAGITPMNISFPLSFSTGF